MLRLISRPRPFLLQHGTRSLFTMLCKGCNLTHPDHLAYLQFLWSFCERMSQHLRCHIFWAAGNDNGLTNRLLYKAVDGKHYADVFREVENPLNLELTDRGPVVIPDPHLIEGCHLLQRSRVYNGGELVDRMVYLAERDMFAGEPNLDELQTELRLFVTKTCYYSPTGIVDGICCEKPKVWETYDREYVKACPHEYSQERHATFLHWLKRAQKVADEGGIPSKVGTGYAALFNFQLKHAYKLHHQYTSYHVKKTAGDHELIWSSFPNEKYYTIDVQGVTSTTEFEIDYVPALQSLIFSAPGLKQTEFSLPAHAMGLSTELVLRDEILTIRVPLRQLFIPVLHEPAATYNEDDFTIDIKLPQGLSPEDVTARVNPAGPTLSVLTKSGLVKHAALPDGPLDTSRMTMTLEETGTLTIRAPKLDKVFGAVRVSSKLRQLRGLLVPPVTGDIL